MRIECGSVEGLDIDLYFALDGEETLAYGPSMQMKLLPATLRNVSRNSTFI
jgi:hypothetical protein